MKLRIQTADLNDREDLRALLIEAAEQLAGPGSCLLEAALPWDGHPILLADQEGHPVLISFDMQHSQAALLGGLQASDQLAAALPWVNQVYEPLKQLQKAPRLVVVSAEPPPGHRALLTGRQTLTLFTCRVLRVNEDTGILLEQLRRQDRALENTAGPRGNAQPLSFAPRVRPQPDTENDLPPLSTEEATYFQQL
jgi:hypothetical protein